MSTEKKYFICDENTGRLVPPKSGEKYSFEDFRIIIDQLRSKNGCAWDREQTHMSLRTCLTEEAAEVNAAIRRLEETGKPDNLREELGDLMLQVLMHTSLAEEEKLFTLEDVVDEVAEKMVRRHPHVYGDLSAEDGKEALQNWEEVKKLEKEKSDFANKPLTEIPLELSALNRGVKLYKRLDKNYHQSHSIEEIQSDLEESHSMVQNAISSGEKENLQKGIQALLLGVCDLSRKEGLNPEQLLLDAIEEHIKKVES